MCGNLNVSITNDLHFETSGETFSVTVNIKNAAPDKIKISKDYLKTLLDEILEAI